MAHCEAAENDTGFHRSFALAVTNEFSARDAECNSYPIRLVLSFAISFYDQLASDASISIPSELTSAKRKRSPNEYPYYVHLECYLGIPDHFFSTDVVLFSPNIAKLYASSNVSTLVTPHVEGGSIRIIWKECLDLDIDETWMRHLFSNHTGGAFIVKCYDAFERCPTYVRLDKSVPDTTGDAKTCANCRLDFGDELSNQAITERAAIMETLNVAQVIEATNPKCKRPKTARQSGGPFSTSDRFGACCLVLNLAHFLRSRPPKILTTRKPRTVTRDPIEPIRNSLLLQNETLLKDVIIGLELEGQFISDELRQILKPIVICTDRLINLPTDPCTTFKEKDNRFTPLYLEWSLGHFPRYRSQYYERSGRIGMDETQVIFAENLTNEQIIRLIYGNSFIVDIYDRNPRSCASPNTADSGVPKLFGANPCDMTISHVNVHDGKLSMPVNQSDPIPSAKVRVDLKEIFQTKSNDLVGLQPVLPNLTPINRIEEEGLYYEIVKNKAFIDYAGQNCLLSISIDFNFEFRLPSIQTNGQRKGIERFVFIAKHLNPCVSEQISTLVSKLKDCIIRNNATCLAIAVKADVQEAISRRFSACIHPYLIQSPEDDNETGGRRSGCVNEKLITGFHVKDPLCDVIILEAEDIQVRQNLKDLISELYGAYPNATAIRVLEHSGMLFTDRLYHELDWSFPTLESPIEFDVIWRSPVCPRLSRTNHLLYKSIETLHNIINNCELTLLGVCQSPPTKQMLLAFKDALCRTDNGNTRIRRQLSDFRETHKREEDQG